MTTTGAGVPVADPAADGAEADAHRTARRIPYEPALDGLRGVAVASVLLYHFGLRYARGGYLGVDAFFVLSGYLITTLLVREWSSSGGIALGRFWAHRVRRLFPALCLVLVAVAAYAALVAKPDIKDQLRYDGLATLFYVMNWRLIASAQSYFDQFAPSPLRHMWSLAIEEQYYLVWPLITLGVLRLWRSARALLVLCGVLAVVSAVWTFALFDPAVDASRLYYGTDTRAQSLLIGSALAAAVAAGLRFTSPLARRLVAMAAVLAALLLAVAWIRLPATSPALYRFGFTGHALLVGVIILACTQIGPNPVRAVLSFEPLRRLGIISYGVYLYHWPIFVWVDGSRTGLAPDSFALFLLRLALTLVVSIASFVLVERPIREGALRRLGVTRWVAPAAAGLVLLLVLVSTNGARATLAFPDQIDPDKRPVPSAGSLDPGDTKVLLVGDSVAYTLGVGFEGAVSDQNDLAVWNQAILFCEMVDGARHEGETVRPASDTCRDWRDQWGSAVDVYRPDVAVLGLGAWEIFDRDIDGRTVVFGTPEYDAILLPILQDAVDTLGADGAPVVLLTTPPFTRDDPNGAPEWTPQGAARVAHFNDLLRQIAADNPDDVILVDVASYVCPDNVCPKEIDGIPMRDDGLHYREEDARLLAGWLAPQLRGYGERSRAGTTGTTPAPPGTVTPPG